MDRLYPNYTPLSLSLHSLSRMFLILFYVGQGLNHISRLTKKSVHSIEPAESLLPGENDKSSGVQYDVGEFNDLKSSLPSL